MDLRMLITVIAGIVLLAALVVGVIAWAVYWDYRRKRFQHEERRLMIERGMTPPPIFSGNWPQVKQHEQQLKFDERRLRIEMGLEVPPEQKKPLTPDDYLRRGTMLLCLGIGCAIAYFALRFATVAEARDAQAWALGLSPVLGLFGVGHLVYYRLTKAEGVK
jgi:hypothetical protein